MKWEVVDKLKVPPLKGYAIEVIGDPYIVKVEDNYVKVCYFGKFDDEMENFMMLLEDPPVFTYEEAEIIKNKVDIISTGYYFLGDSSTRRITYDSKIIPVYY